MERKYPNWGLYLRSNREKKYRSAREFCARGDVGISYPQYSRYEGGEQLPGLAQALELGKKLDLQPFETVEKWLSDQFPADHASLKDDVLALLRSRTASKGSLAPAIGVNPNPLAATASRVPENTMRLDDVIVLNRSHVRSFGTNPRYRDVITYVNSFPTQWISQREIAIAAQIGFEEAGSLIEDLHELGVLVLPDESTTGPGSMPVPESYNDKDGYLCRCSKRIFYYPDDEDFFPLRNLNFVHNVSSLMRNLSFKDIQAKKSYRGLLTRQMSPSQVSTLIERVDSLIHDVIQQPEEDASDGVYSMCVVFGERFRREAVLAELDTPKSES
ncbi:MAG: helix-turn-helix transcriptional regulator [Bdellovibrionales bacterium]|nr:helix-turn-helix transcriptional regulator [Bdellovibrionales bacterium]